MKHLLLLSAWCVGVCAGAAGQDAKKYPDPAPMTHDMSEFWTPQPKIVTPPDMDNAVVAPPSDAVVLLGLKDNAISEWKTARRQARRLADRERDHDRQAALRQYPHEKGFRRLPVAPRVGAPTEIVGESQGRGNSGVFMQGMYEVQILKLPERNLCERPGREYLQADPAAGERLQKPGKWNTYDIIYTAPRFKEDGSLQSHGRITVLHNGVLVQNNTMILERPSLSVSRGSSAHGAGARSSCRII